MYVYTYIRMLMKMKGMKCLPVSIIEELNFKKWVELNCFVELFILLVRKNLINGAQSIQIWSRQERKQYKYRSYGGLKLQLLHKTHTKSPIFLSDSQQGTEGNHNFFSAAVDFVHLFGNFFFF